MGMLKVISLVLLLIRLRFPLDKSITHFLRYRYGNLVVKELRKYDIIPKSLNFRVSNSYLKSSRTYHACQIKLLKEELSFKKIIEN